MSSRKLEDLYKPLQEVAEKALQIAKEKGKAMAEGRKGKLKRSGSK